MFVAPQTFDQSACGMWIRNRQAGASAKHDDDSTHVIIPSAERQHAPQKLPHRKASKPRQTKLETHQLPVPRDLARALKPTRRHTSKTRPQPPVALMALQKKPLGAKC